MKRVALTGLLALVLAVPATAGDLDSAYQFWQVTNVQLGHSTIAARDTCVDSVGTLIAAVNSCIRKWAANPGITGYDTLTVVAGTFVYTLNSNFMEDGIGTLPFKVFGVSADGNTVYGLVRGEVQEISNYAEPDVATARFDVTGDQVWLSSAQRDGDKLYLSGPVVGLTMTDGADTTNVFDQDRAAICDCAAAVILTELERPDKARFYWERYLEHVRARGGMTAGLVPAP